jgi:hypothetical protein
MKRLGIVAVAAAVLGTGLADAADAAVWNFSYQSSSVLLAGQLEGTLQPDGNTVVISAIVGTPTVNGSPAVPLPFVNSYANYLISIIANPVVTLDGSAMDFLACTSGACIDGFFFFADPGGSFGGGDSFGSVFEPFDANSWSLSLVPEPASWALMIAGFGLVGSAVRRRKAALAA